MMRPVRTLLQSGVALATIGVLVMIATVSAYVDRSRVFEESASLVVFRNGYVTVEGKSPSFVQSIPFELSFEPTVLLCGIVLIVAALGFAATAWAPHPHDH